MGKFAKTRARWLQVLLGVCAIGAAPSAAQSSQAARPGGLQILVRDATAAAIAGAEVTILAPDGSTQKTRANERGEAVFEALPPGA